MWRSVAKSLILPAKKMFSLVLQYIGLLLKSIFLVIDARRLENKNIWTVLIGNIRLHFYKNNISN